MAYGPACGDPDATALLLARRQEHIATFQPPPAQRHSMQRVFRLLTGKTECHFSPTCLPRGTRCNMSLLACRGGQMSPAGVFFGPTRRRRVFREQAGNTLYGLHLGKQGGIKKLCLSLRQGRRQVAWSASRRARRRNKLHLVRPCDLAGEQMHGVHLGGHHRDKLHYVPLGKQ